MNYSVLDILVTLRCNGGCRNCNKLCGMENITGLNYSNTDMTLPMLHHIIEDVKALRGPQPVIDRLYLTGGEPLLHPRIEEMAALVAQELGSYITSWHINTNASLPVPPSLKDHIITFSSLADKPSIHKAILLHPSQMTPPELPAFNTCGHRAKQGVVVSVFGYSLCCVADGYIKLFGLNNLILPHLPQHYADFPLHEMDAVCQHCVFGCRHQPFESDVGCPVSNIYAEQAKLNRAGRQPERKLPT